MSLGFPDKFFDWLASDDGFLLREDILAWIKWRRLGELSFEDAAWTLFRRSEFRSLIDYRTSRSANGAEFTKLFKQFPRATDLYIVTEKVGPRLIIVHGHGTWILAKEIGSDFTINHNVTIGHANGLPTICDRVTLRTGAVVVGPCRLESDVVVAPTAFVNFDVPAKSYVFPAKSCIVPRER